MKQKRGRKGFSKEYLLNKMKESHELLGYSPSYIDLRNLAKNGFPYPTAYERHFGSINKTKELCSIPKNRNVNDGNGNKILRKSCKIRFTIFKRDNFRCVYCGRGAVDNTKITIDHVIPIQKKEKT